MEILADSTVFVHLLRSKTKMQKVLRDFGVTQIYISRIGYLEILAGATIHRKTAMRKFLADYPILEYNSNCVKTNCNLAMKYQVVKHNSKDFFIAAIAISNGLPLLTENNKDYNYKELKVLPYRIVKSIFS